MNFKKDFVAAAEDRKPPPFSRRKTALRHGIHPGRVLRFVVTQRFYFMSTTTKPSSTATKKDTRLVDSLNLVLADSYQLMALTHLAHWNVEGDSFFQLHTAFQKQYEELFEAVDDIAERVRALDAYAIGGLSTLARTAGMEEFKSPMPQKDYVAALIVAHEKVADDATRTRDLAGELNDLQTQDLMIGRLQSHEKVVWMLKSFLK